MELDHVHNFGDCERCKKPAAFVLTVHKAYRVTAVLCALCFWTVVGKAEDGFVKVATQDSPINSFREGANYLFAGTSASLSPSAATIRVMDFAMIQPKISHPLPDSAHFPKITEELF